MRSREENIIIINDIKEKYKDRLMLLSPLDNVDTLKYNNNDLDELTRIIETTAYMIWNDVMSYGQKSDAYYTIEEKTLKHRVLHRENKFEYNKISKYSFGLLLTLNELRKSLTNSK